MQLQELELVFGHMERKNGKTDGKTDVNVEIVIQIYSVTPCMF